MATLYLIRHGETDWNKQGRYQGHSDIPLNSQGREQAHDAMNRLHCGAVDAIYSSDLCRATETAEIIASKWSIDVQCDARLREIQQGVWEGMVFEEINARYGDTVAARRTSPLTVSPPGGETLAEVRERVLECVEEIVQRHAGGQVVIVSHGVALALVRLESTGADIAAVWGLIQPNAGIEIVELKARDFI